MSKRKDLLAAGARSATFMGGSGENDIFRNVAPEGSRDESVPVVEPVKIVRKRFIPNAGVLLIRRDEAAAASTLIVTEKMEKEEPSEGIVLEVGPKVDIAVGAHVVFGKYSGAQFKLNGETLLLMDAEDIKGTIVDEQQPPYEDEDDKTWLFNKKTGKWDIPAKAARRKKLGNIPGIPRA